jgi:hypothetical protein
MIYPTLGIKSNPLTGSCIDGTESSVSSKDR